MDSNTATQAALANRRSHQNRAKLAKLTARIDALEETVSAQALLIAELDERLAKASRSPSRSKRGCATKKKTTQEE
jgi:hypothetical protein